MNEKILYEYQNGNTHVTIYSNGTKVREFPDNEIPKSIFPESMDIKITNMCDAACKYCHEKSTINGKHGNMHDLIEVLDLANLPKGIELALGGGNPLEHPLLLPFLIWCESKGFICNMTVNEKHADSKLLESLIKQELIKGLGLSYSKNLNKYADYEHTVVHLILGLVTVQEVMTLISKGYKKFLFLGYKEFGRGINYFSEHNEEITSNIIKWKKDIIFLLFQNHITISFDNLAIDQLELKKIVPSHEWNKRYMGDEFTHSMYIDAVNQTFSESSRTEFRVNWKDSDLLTFFNNK